MVVAPVWAEPYWPGATPNLGLREHRLSRLGQVTSTFWVWAFFPLKRKGRNNNNSDDNDKAYEDTQLSAHTHWQRVQHRQAALCHVALIWPVGYWTGPKVLHVHHQSKFLQWDRILSTCPHFYSFGNRLGEEIFVRYSRVRSQIDIGKRHENYANRQVVFRACKVLPDPRKPTEQSKIPAGITNKVFTHTMKGKQSL